ncbi:hypothetical protein TWF225_001384 [Orbilia oligospora]|nr:hypothetical protein TWF225_001384 [Orbilia oligospora]KAF3249612.1 hypothetical protein TWF217_008817 [Orbilia oligospora]
MDLHNKSSEQQKLEYIGLREDPGEGLKCLGNVEPAVEYTSQEAVGYYQTVPNRGGRLVDTELLRACFSINGTSRVHMKIPTTIMQKATNPGLGLPYVRTCSYPTDPSRGFRFIPSYITFSKIEFIDQPLYPPDTIDHKASKPN